MSDELSKFYSRKEIVSAASAPETAERLEKVSTETQDQRESVIIGSIFESINYKPLSRTRRRVRSSSIL